ncbi:DLW-39 family protein [Solicola sp. PLA-1-18]
MKKLLALALAAGAALWATSRSRKSQAEKDLWAEATDTV